MKISDFIFRFSTRRSRNDGLCRVRTFVCGDSSVTALITDVGSLGTGHSVTNTIEDIREGLVRQGLVPEFAKLIEHYESVSGTATFDVLSFDHDQNPRWNKITATQARSILGCSEGELGLSTSQDERLLTELARQRTALDRFHNVPALEDRKTIAYRLILEDKMIAKSELAALVEAGSSERELQRLVKSDLTIMGEAYGTPDENYIAFSEFPIGNGFVDFVVFTGCSRMDVVLVEVKGADFLISNKNSYGKFCSKIEEAAHQVRDRLSVIHRDYEAARRSFHDVRARAEAGERIYGALKGPRCPLQVDPNKDVNLRCVVIGGRTRDDVADSRKRHAFENFRTGSSLVSLESWDSWLRKLQRR